MRSPDLFNDSLQNKINDYPLCYTPCKFFIDSHSISYNFVHFFNVLSATFVSILIFKGFKRKCVQCWKFKYNLVHNMSTYSICKKSRLFELVSSEILPVLEKKKILNILNVDIFNLIS